MRICLDIQSAIAQRAGVGRYTKLLAEHLVSCMGEDELLAFFFDFKRKGLPFTLPGARVRANRLLPGRVVQKAWKTLGFPPYDWFAGSADLYHFPNFIRPPLMRGRSVVTIHDVSFLRFPKTLEPRNHAFLSKHIRQTVEKADAIITDCAFVAEELQELLGVPAGKLHPILLGNTPGMQAASPENVTRLRLEHDLQRPYLLHVGTLEPRKNQRFLFDVFEQLPDFDGDLVLAGGEGWQNEPILKRLEESPLRHRIRRLSYMDDRDLPALYSGAECFLFPSLYEGFGFPPLEAMACGTPAVSSPEGSLREVLEGGAVLVDLDDPAPWVEAVHRLLSDTAHREEQIARGREFAARYQWHKTAAQTHTLYRSLGS